MSTWTTDFAGEMNSCFAQKHSGNQPCVLPNQHADHLLGLSQMAIWKAFSSYLLCDVTAHFSAWLIYHFMPKNWITLYFSLLSSWRVWHDFNVSVFLTRKEHMQYFENWLHSTACELTLRICNFLKLPCGMYLCLLLRSGNLKISL